jgi:large subunit ribosomal protein L28
VIGRLVRRSASCIDRYRPRPSEEAMSRECEVTGKKPLMGNNVSHSNVHTKKRFEINLVTKRFWLEDEKRWITLRVTTRGMRTIDKRGLAAVVKDLRAAGKKI